MVQVYLIHQILLCLLIEKLYLEYRDVFGSHEMDANMLFAIRICNAISIIIVLDMYVGISCILQLCLPINGYCGSV